SSKVGNYVLMARKANNGDWYMGAMTDWSPRKLTANLSFLGKGKFKMYIWQDGINADRNAKDFKTVIKDVDSSSDIAIDMAKGGGWVARIVKSDL
ncbi:MAG: glycoside hydrolase family 97 C-terminal domain-containing protein, partial [Bacteroidota bacterium]|nr:glycoside hydrolase family 97 C-terminal domain-containing protein [Bacteroidota bacterium]MDP4275619.1 glycoside hydrolase family 97 C-terminal domain-containing protein [Bacteroidota bacterium]